MTHTEEKKHENIREMFHRCVRKEAEDSTSLGARCVRGFEKGCDDMLCPSCEAGVWTAKGETN